jgi:hypothetical protein
MVGHIPKEESPFNSPKNLVRQQTSSVSLVPLVLLLPLRVSSTQLLGGGDACRVETWNQRAFRYKTLHIVQGLQL